MGLEQVNRQKDGYDSRPLLKQSQGEANLKKIITFKIDEYQGNTHTPYYSAHIGRTEIIFSMTDTHLDFLILLWGYYKEYKCNIGYCKNSESDKCDWEHCKNKVKIPDTYDHYIDCDRFDYIAHLLKIDNYEETPLEKVKIIKKYLIGILNNDQALFEPAMDFICPKKDIKKFESSLWDINGVLV